jgi:hypothetical protein
MPDAVGMHALTNLSSDLKTIDKAFASAIRRNLRNAIRQQGQVVVDAVRSRASWSSRIPGATGVSIRYSTVAASVKVSVDHRKAPHARPLEEGNRDSFSEEAVDVLGGYKVVNGRRVAVNRSAYSAIRSTGIGLSRVLRHPVFHQTSEPGGYAEMPTRPFFKPAVDASSPGIDRAMENVVIQTARGAGFKEV